MDRTTNEIFKFIHKIPVGMSLAVLYKEFPNKTAVDESYKILISQGLIVNRDGNIELTVTGYDYYYNRNKECFLKILKTLISPIVVGVITSIVTARLVSLPNDCNCNVTCDYPNNNLKQQD